jgi:2-phospho-L-lactate transferase/gluconeogenesis factor (CofD/UPF0052 family)
MWQPGETSNFAASDHITAIRRHGGGGKLLDYAIVNTQPIRASLRQRYAHEQALPVENDLDRIEQMGIRVVGGNFLQESEKVRHNPEEIAAVAIRLAREGRARRASAGNARPS